MSGRRTTIKDIAQRLGLAVSTVSRALNDRWEVSPETRELVLRTAEEMHYSPNAQARGLVTRKSKMIGLIVPDMLSSTFFSTIALEIQKTLIAKGYHLIITQSNESPEEERRLLMMMRENNVDGIIISTAIDSEYNRDLFEAFVQDKIALVFISRVCGSIPVPKIVLDDVEMASQVVEHLIQEGCRKILFISGPEGVPASVARREGYRLVLARHGLEPPAEPILSRGLQVQDGIDAAEKMLKSGLRPDAVFVINDTVAFGIMKVLKQRGIRIPEEMAVAGFSESFTSTFIEPNLTSVAQPLTEMGVLAARQLLRQLDGFEPVDTTIVLHGQLIIRTSSQRREAASD
ncbi:MAG: LacI family DNA-binding transcriptional regulator [Bacteroidales bacterium]|nr:LacI family DNA-binding transcriptional regulator [Bacteroidales bacterium]